MDASYETPSSSSAGSARNGSEKVLVEKDLLERINDNLTQANANTSELQAETARLKAELAALRADTARGDKGIDIPIHFHLKYNLRQLIWEEKFVEMDLLLPPEMRKKPKSKGITVSHLADS